MKKVCRLSVLLLALLAVLPSCSPKPATEQTLPSQGSNTVEHCLPDLPNTSELNHMIFQASGNDFTDSNLQVNISSAHYDKAVLYQAIPVFPNEQAQGKWKSLADGVLSALASQNDKLKADFTIEKVKGYFRLNAIYETMGEKGWQQSGGFFCYWNAEKGDFVDFLTLFDGFEDYRQYFADFLTQQCEAEELKAVTDPQKLSAFLGGDLSFSQFEIVPEGVNVTLNTLNLLSEGAEVTLFIPDCYFDGTIIEKLTNKWKEYTPVQPGEKVVCLTFDDGPAPANTNAILDVLEQNHAKATFFMAGHRIHKNTYPVLQRVLKAGSQIGNHSYSHANFHLLDLAGIMEEINRTQELVYEATGTYPTCIRPPYGNLKLELVKETGMYSIHWNVDTLDWQHKNTQTLVDYVLNNTRSGDIVLMHDIHKSTADGVEAIVKGLQEQGFRLVTVEEMFDLRNTQPSGYKYFSQSIVR